MEQYISKSALVAKIERRIKTNKECRLDLRNLDYYQGKVDALNDTLSFINSLEVKEVDLEKEIDREIETRWRGEYLFETKFRESVKHFFQLGLSASNPITAEDRGIAEEIIISLKQVENDYRIDLTREIEWLRNKVKG